MFIVYYFPVLACYKEVHKSTANYIFFSKWVDSVVKQYSGGDVTSLAEMLVVLTVSSSSSYPLSLFSPSAVQHGKFKNRSLIRKPQPPSKSLTIHHSLVILLSMLYSPIDTGHSNGHLSALGTEQVQLLFTCIQ
jgi:hypothetical protein